MIGARIGRPGPGLGPYVCITGIIHTLNSQPRTITSASPTFGIIQNSQCNWQRNCFQDVKTLNKSKALLLF